MRWCGDDVGAAVRWYSDDVVWRRRCGGGGRCDSEVVQGRR